MDRLRNTSFLNYLSPALQHDAFFVALAQGLDAELQKFLAKIPVNIIISNLANQPENVLDFIAKYHFGVDGYDLNLPYPNKLLLCQNAIINKVNKGTPSAIKSVMAVAFNYCELIEWWQDSPPAVPHTFRIKINDPLVDTAKVDKMMKLIMKLKNVRSLFTGIRSFLQVPAGTVYASSNVAEYDYDVLPYRQTVL